VLDSYHFKTNPLGDSASPNPDRPELDATIPTGVTLPLLTSSHKGREVSPTQGLWCDPHRSCQSRSREYESVGEPLPHEHPRLATSSLGIGGHVLSTVLGFLFVAARRSTAMSPEGYRHSMVFSQTRHVYA
jgi:hypothetical protein